MPTLKPEDVQRMKEIQASTSRHLMQFQNTEAAIAVAALMLCANTLLKLYNPASRDELVEVMVMFLKGESPDMTVIPFDLGGGGKPPLIQ